MSTLSAASVPGTISVTAASSAAAFTSGRWGFSFFFFFFIVLYGDVNVRRFISDYFEVVERSDDFDANAPRPDQLEHCDKSDA